MASATAKGDLARAEQAVGEAQTAEETARDRYNGAERQGLPAGSP
jgi:hypothetical protein